MTPAQCDCSPGSQHILEAPSSQIPGPNRHLFGRWHDGGSSRRTVTAGPGSTWIEANYIAQQTLRACAIPPGEASVSVFPQAEDGYFPIQALVEIEASLAPGGSLGFVQWNFPHLSSGSGVAANPISVPLARHLRFLVDFATNFSEEPRFRIESNVPWTWVQVNGAWRILPWSFPVSRYADGVTVQARETVPEAVSFGTSVRDRFDNWSDGGDLGHALDVPQTGGQLRLDLRREYRLRTAARSRWDDGAAIEASLPSGDGMYAAGTQVTLTAVPEHGGYLAGWTGDASGRDSVQTVAMDAARSVEAIFTRSQPLVPGEAKEVSLSASSQYRPYSGGEGCNVLVPPDAGKLTVAFESPIVGVEVDLQVRRGLEVRADDRGAGTKPRIAADHESTSPGAAERIVIERGDSPPLRTTPATLAWPFHRRMWKSEGH